MSSVLKVDAIQNTAGTSALTIDSSGRVNAPALPRIFVGHSTNGGISYSSGDQFVNTSTVVHNITAVGITFDGSNGRFTLPVAGDYYVSYFNITYGGTGTVAWVVKLNGTSKLFAYISGDGNRWDNISCSGIVSATAGQYLNIENSGDGATYEGHGGAYAGFSVHLLG